MKVYMLESGKLSIEGESVIEDYALKKWYEDWGKGQSVLQVCLPDENRPSLVIPHKVEPRH